MIRTAPLALAALIALPAAASAHSNDARLTEQAGQIERGRQDGSITWREGLRLRQEQRDIARALEEMSADGRLTKQEQRVLHAIQNKAEQSIADEASDGWRRWWVLPRIGR